MKQPLRPMWDDPNENPLVRDLIRAGREDGAAAYDVQQGLSAHLAHLKAGTAAPAWGRELVVTGSTAAVGGSIPFWGWIAASVLGAVSGGYLWVADGPGMGASSAVGGQSDSALVVRAEGKRRSISSVSTGALRADGTRTLFPASEAAGPAQAARRRQTEVLPAQRRVAQKMKSRGRYSAVVTTTVSAKTGLKTGVLAGPVGIVSESEIELGAPMGASESGLASDTVTERQAHRDRQPAQTIAAEPVAAPTAVGGRIANIGRTSAKPVARPTDATDAETSINELRLEREMRMLKVAQAMLDSDPARSLRLAQLGEKEFKGSLFTQERRYVLISALARLGRTVEARLRATAYLSNYPTGPFSERVRQALGK